MCYVPFSQSSQNLSLSPIHMQNLNPKPKNTKNTNPIKTKETDKDIPSIKF